MSALAHLAMMLRPALEEGARAMAASKDIDVLLSDMKAKAKSNGAGSISEDRQLDAVRRYWESQQVRSFGDARLLSYGLCVPHRKDGPCVLEDRPRLRGVLDAVDTWTARPSLYRRCYQGLVRSYFTYDALGDNVQPTAKNNWKLLREYLHDRNGSITDKVINPEWVATANDNRPLFSEEPCSPYVDALLRGDVGAIEHLCEQLGIAQTSWFMRELVLAQIRGATDLGNAQFQALLPRLLQLLTDLLANNDGLRDRGLVMVLDRYHQVPGQSLHQELRDASVRWWGNPWLPSNATRWGGVVPKAREMVADWLKLEFIELFFTKLAEDGLSDKRRMLFWKRYVKAIDHIEFALGTKTRNSREKDFLVLRKKMTGLIRDLDSSTTNAFIMTMGNLVAVEFSGVGNAFYGYDARDSLPFDTSRSLCLPVDAKNSLKHTAHTIKMGHQDGIHNWDKWEQMFEATLKKEFGIKAGAEGSPTAPTFRRSPAPPPATSRTPAPAATPAPTRQIPSFLSEPYTRAALNKMTFRLGLEVDDLTAKGGSLWVRTDNKDQDVSLALRRWGFGYKPDKGWWK
jgi:hypothetical protein